MQTWTPEQILSLAPDSSSAKAGRELSSPRKWQNVGRNDQALWGEHQGSGSRPYLTSIDLTEPAFKCSCPSRKFPCKHGLGLFLAFAGEPTAFPTANPPQWAAEWLAARAEKEERAAKREERKEQGANDPEAKAKVEKAAARTAAQRKSRVDKGIEDLDRWLCDMIRTGFSAPNLATYSFWESQAARLVDGQAPGLARIVRNMGYLATSSTGDASRHERLLEQAGRLHLIIQAYNRLETLTPTMQDEIRTLVGWTQDQAELIASAPTLPETHRARDKWFVASQVISDDDKLRAQSTWLWSTTQPRAALIMDFAFGNNPLDKSLVVGTQIDVELVYFPGAYPLRALVKERFGPPTDLTNLEVWSIEDALVQYNLALQQNPLLDRFPMFLADVIPVFTSNSGGDARLTYIRNAEGDTLPINPATDRQAALGYLALSAGHPVMIFGIWNGKHFSPLNAWANTLDLDTPTHVPSEDTRAAGDAEPTIWDAILTSALLGTERRPPNIPPTNGPLGAVLTGIRESSAISPEQSLLAAASTLTIYRQAGKLPAHDGAPLPDPCAPETLKVCSPRAIAHLYDMLNGNNSRALTEWLEAAAAHGRHITHDVLPAMLDLGQAQPYYQPYMLPVIGNRGRWLAQQFGTGNKWAYVRNAATIETPDEESTLALWETGSLDARVAILLDMRKTRPDRARELLESVWKQENAKTRAALVRALEVSLSMQDEPFLESVLDDRSSEVAKEATKHLAILAGSRFLQRAIASTQSALKLNRVRQNRLFGLGQSTGKDTIEVTLPEEYTPAMKRDQIEPKSSAPALGDRAYWLLQQISRVPPRIWSERLQAEPRAIVDAAARTKEWKSLLMQAFMSATLTHKDAEWAEAFLAQGIATLHDYTLSSLVSLLPPDRRDRLITGILASQPEALYTNDLPLDFLWTLQKPWTIELCRAVLKSVAHHIKHNTPKQSNWQVSQSLSTFAYSMPPSIYLEAERTLVTNESTSANSKEAVDEFLTTLKFRQDMLQALQQ